MTITRLTLTGNGGWTRRWARHWKRSGRPDYRPGWLAVKGRRKQTTYVTPQRVRVLPAAIRPRTAASGG
jgi:hypothetical protein